MHGFSSKQRVLCVECGLYTKYQFQLLRCRLCERCEHAHAKYALVTALEAMQRHGLPAGHVKQLPCVDSCGTQFYLRSSVIALINKNKKPYEIPTQDDDSDHEDDHATGEGDAQHGCTSKTSQQQREFHPVPSQSNSPSQEGPPEAGSSPQGDHNSDEEEEDSDDDQGKGRKHDPQREAMKAARKAAKKQAKMEQRLKREAKAAGGAKSGASYATLSGLLSQALKNSGKATLPAASGNAQRGHPATPPQQQRGRVGPASAGRGGPSQQQRAGRAVIDNPYEYSSGDEQQQMGMGRPGRNGGGKRGGKGKAGRSNAQAQAQQRRGTNFSQMHQGLYPDEGTNLRLYGSSPKVKSQWLAEREAIMREFGQYGISGLVLAE